MARGGARPQPVSGLVAEPDGWWSCRDGEARLILAEGDRPFAPGWRRLVLDGVQSDAILHPALEIVGGETGDDIVEYTLPAIQRGRLEIVVHVDRPFRRAALAPSDGAALFRLVSARFERFGPLRLLADAARRDPRKAFEAVVARLRGKRVRAHNRLKAIFASVPGADYAGWAGARGRLWARQAADVADAAATWASRPAFCVVVALDGPAGELAGPLAGSARSLIGQSWPDWRLIVAAPGGAPPPSGWPFDDPRILFVEADDEPASRAACRAATGDFVIALLPGDRLAADALLRMADRARQRPAPAMIYGDDDALDAEGHRRAPRFKPDFDVDLFCAADYLGGPALAIGRDLLEGDAATARGAGLARLALAAAPGAIVHVPCILAHRVAAAARDHESAAPERRAAIEAAFAGRAAASPVDGRVRLRWRLPDPPPLASVIVCTRDRLDLLRPCIEGLRQATDYAALEIVIADNDSAEPATRAYLGSLADDPRVRIVPCPGPFNFSAINNRAARAARGRLLVFMNNDVETVHADWLTEMAGLAARPEVGAVGARLLYPDGRIQHAGVVVGINGLAGHAHRFFPADHPGYMGRLVSTQRFSAVTAACLCVRADAFFAVGGFEETLFPVAFNDVDLCLKLQAAGLANLYTPHATLLHKETASRPRDASPERLERWRVECRNLRERWPAVIAADPWYNPNLTRTAEDFSLA